MVKAVKSNKITKADTRPLPGRYHIHVIVSKTGRMRLDYFEHYTPSLDKKIAKSSGMSDISVPRSSKSKRLRLFNALHELAGAKTSC